MSHPPRAFWREIQPNLKVLRTRAESTRDAHNGRRTFDTIWGGPSAHGTRSGFALGRWSEVQLLMGDWQLGLYNKVGVLAVARYQEGEDAAQPWTGERTAFAYVDGRRVPTLFHYTHKLSVARSVLLGFDPSRYQGAGDLIPTTDELERILDPSLIARGQNFVSPSYAPSESDLTTFKTYLADAVRSLPPIGAGSGQSGVQE